MECVHYGQILESSLPIITDAEHLQPLEEDLSKLAKNFRVRMGRFMMKRARNKLNYKIGKKYKFLVNELVMMKIYVAKDICSFHNN